MASALSARLSLHGALQDYERIISVDCLSDLGVDPDYRVDIPGRSLLWGADTPPLLRLMPEDYHKPARYRASLRNMLDYLRGKDGSMSRTGSWHPRPFWPQANPSLKDRLVASVCTGANMASDLTISEDTLTLADPTGKEIRLVEITCEGVRWNDEWFALEGPIQWENFYIHTARMSAGYIVSALKQALLIEDPMLDLLLTLHVGGACDTLSLTGGNPNVLSLTIDAVDADTQPVGARWTYDTLKMAPTLSLPDYCYGLVAEDVVDVNLLALFNFYVVKTETLNPRAFHLLVRRKRAIVNHQANVVPLRVSVLRKMASLVHDTVPTRW